MLVPLSPHEKIPCQKSSTEDDLLQWLNTHKEVKCEGISSELLGFLHSDGSSVNVRQEPAYTRTTKRLVDPSPDSFCLTLCHFHGSRQWSTKTCGVFDSKHVLDDRVFVNSYTTTAAIRQELKLCGSPTANTCGWSGSVSALSNLHLQLGVCVLTSTGSCFWKTEWQWWLKTMWSHLGT